MTPDQALWFADSFGKLVNNIEQAIVGKTHTIRLALTTLLSDGHLLLEDVPGTGKTMLAKALANTVQGTQSRIQFTPDLLPSDVTGVTIYDQRTARFEFHKGPIFATIVLADEINRASPKTQSALLEVMEEARVSVDGQTYDRLSRPARIACPRHSSIAS
jgi:MoxR-like ATPase